MVERIHIPKNDFTAAIGDKVVDAGLARVRAGYSGYKHCWDFANTVYGDAGHGQRDINQVWPPKGNIYTDYSNHDVRTSAGYTAAVQKGDPAKLLQRGDWVYINNRNGADTYGNHSGVFAGWADEEHHKALIISGPRPGTSANVRTFDVTNMPITYVARPRGSTNPSHTVMASAEATALAKPGIVGSNGGGHSPIVPISAKSGESVSTNTQPASEADMPPAVAWGNSDSAHFADSFSIAPLLAMLQRGKKRQKDDGSEEESNGSPNLVLASLIGEDDIKPMPVGSAFWGDLQVVSRPGGRFGGMAGLSRNQTVVRPWTGPSVGALSGNREARISQLMKAAIQVHPDSEIMQRITVAQAINENGWDISSGLAKHNNLFGIKGSGTAGSVNMPTWEVYGGQTVHTNANFAANTTVEDSFLQHDRLLKRDRYHAVREAKTFDEAADALLRAGYGTDPRYPANMKGIDRRLQDLWAKVRSEPAPTAQSQPQVAGTGITATVATGTGGEPVTPAPAPSKATTPVPQPETGEKTAPPITQVSLTMPAHAPATEARPQFTSDPHLASFARRDAGGGLIGGNDINRIAEIASCAKVVILWSGLRQLQNAGYDMNQFLDSPNQIIAGMKNPPHQIPTNRNIISRMLNNSDKHAADLFARTVQNNLGGISRGEFLRRVNGDLKENVSVDGQPIHDTIIKGAIGGGQSTARELSGIMARVRQDFPKIFGHNENTYGTGIFNVAPADFGKPGDTGHGKYAYMGVLPNNRGIIAVTSTSPSNMTEGIAAAGNIAPAPAPAPAGGEPKTAEAAGPKTPDADKKETDKLPIPVGHRARDKLLFAARHPEGRTAVNDHHHRQRRDRMLALKASKAHDKSHGPHGTQLAKKKTSHREAILAKGHDKPPTLEIA